MTDSELRSDIHSIEPIPDADRDSTGPQQMWIWAGANIAPVNWALGALGIILKLGLWETIAVIVFGNLIGCAIFSAMAAKEQKVVSPTGLLAIVTIVVTAVLSLVQPVLGIIGSIFCMWVPAKSGAKGYILASFILDVLTLPVGLGLSVLTIALQAGATAYVSRTASIEHMVSAVRAALDQERFVDPGLPPRGSRGKLTRRQREILQLLADGGSNALAARELGLSEETVKTHTKNALARLGARNRTHAVAIALRESLIE